MDIFLELHITTKLWLATDSKLVKHSQGKLLQEGKADVTGRHGVKVNFRGHYNNAR